MIERARQALGEVRGLFYHPGIPEQLQQAVRRVHAESLPADEPILLLYDDTVFGSGEDGFVLTPRRVCWKRLTEEPASLLWSCVGPGDVTCEGSRVHIGAGTLPLTAWDASLSAALAGILAAHVGELRQNVRVYRDGRLGVTHKDPNLVLQRARAMLGGCSRVHLHPDIPPSAEEAARRAFGVGSTESEPILVLYDDSLFASARVGFVLTSKRICWRRFLEPPTSVRWDQVHPSSIRLVGDRIQLVGGILSVTNRSFDARRVAQLITDIAGSGESPFGSEL